MEASGFPNGFTTELLIASGDPVETGISTIVKAQLAEIGITVNIQQVEAGTKFDLRNNRQFEMFLASTSADQIDPQGFWSFCCAAQRNRGSAFTDYIEEDMIALYEEVTKTGGPRRAEIFAEMQAIGWDDAAQLFLVFIDAPIGVRSNVQGFVVPPTRIHVLDTVYKTE
jgi:peptide/nickel transport system substrate-binding protein